MRLTKQYAYALLTSIPDEDSVDLYYELTRVVNLFGNVPEYVHMVEFQPEEFAGIRDILSDEISPLLTNFLEVLAQDRVLRSFEDNY